MTDDNESRFGFISGLIACGLIMALTAMALGSFEPASAIQLLFIPFGENASV